MLDFIASWRRERGVLQELARLSDRELADLGIERCDIRAVTMRAFREGASRHSREHAATFAPAWGAHNRRSVVA